MATPHVSGAIARIWAALPGCTSDQVKEALYSTAKDLGETGKDNYFGYGLLQTEDAYNYLNSLPPPCGTNAPPGGVEQTPAPSETPFEIPVAGIGGKIGRDGEKWADGGERIRGGTRNRKRRTLTKDNDQKQPVTAVER